MLKEQQTLITGKYVIIALVFSSTRAAKKELQKYQEKFPHAEVEQKSDVILVKYIQ